ncbi:Alkane-1 monooxygenase [Minicystis rosea]|nr:Alkane-1 monooxygenase [Minicystis rosea]
MSSAVITREPAARPLSTLRTWALHLISIAFPLYVLAYVLTGPHRWYASLPWLLVIPALMALDRFSGRALHAPSEGMSAWPFDAILVALTALQLANIVLTARMMARGSLLSADTLVASILVGASSGYSAIVVAHELIHRKSRFMQLLGRALLGTVCYEHFFTEHVRGHHLHVGTDADPATSRYGETYGAFWNRTVVGQLKSAWRIEAKRLGDEDMTWRDPRALRSAVVHGIVGEVAFAVALGVIFGPAALVVHLGQAYVAVRLLEAVNYFEHYGLRRSGRKVRPVDSWDSESLFTLFALVGLSRHADHHAYAARPFQALRTWDESPKLPYGYVCTTLMAIFAGERLRAHLDAELARKKLGPFATA